MNKILKIILVLIGAFFLILAIIWLIGRNSAIKSGKEPLTFRQFLGLSTKKNPESTTTGEGSSDFTNSGSTGSDNTNGTTTGTGANGGTDSNVNVSQFTNGTTNLTTGGTSSLGSGTGNDSSTGNPSTDASGDNNISTDSPGNSDAGSQSVCSEEDTNIEFTPAQIEQLNILQNRFYTLAQTLHSDADVATEVANHDAFTLKANNVLSLYAYCEAQLPAINAIADNRLKVHVATPFWRSYGSDATIPAFVKVKTGTTIPATDVAQDSVSLINFAVLDTAYLERIHDTDGKNKENDPSVRGPYGLLMLTNPQFVQINGSLLDDANPLLIPVVEKVLRINLW